MAPRDRHRPDDSRGRRTAGAEVRERHRAGAHRGRRACCPRSTNAKAPETHLTQYFEIFGNRGHLQRRLAGRHRAPGRLGGEAADDARQGHVGALRHANATSASANDLAAKNPAKLKEMQALFLKEAVKYNVLPIDDRLIERTNAALVGRPDLMGGRTSLTVYDGMIGMSENVFINTKNRSHTITAEVDDPARRRQRRDPRAGRPVRRLEPVSEGRQADLHVQLPRARSASASRRPTPVPAGKATIRYEFAYDGGGLGQGRHLARSTSTARRWPKAGSIARSR